MGGSNEATPPSDAPSAGDPGINLALLGGQMKTIGDKALSTLRTKVKVGPFRTPREFFGLGEAKAFGAPPAAEVVARLRFNALFFSTNYLAVYLILVMLSIISSPISLLSLGLLAGGWFFVTRAPANPEVNTISFGSVQVARPIAYAVMLGASILCGILLLESMFSWPLWVGAAAAMGHATLREQAELAPPPQMTGDIEDSELRQFLGAAQA